jgi:hypothetical protein
VERLQPPRAAETVEEEDAAADEVVPAAVGKEEVSGRRSEWEERRAL